MKVCKKCGKTKRSSDMALRRDLHGTDSLANSSDTCVDCYDKHRESLYDESGFVKAEYVPSYLSRLHAGFGMTRGEIL